MRRWSWYAYRVLYKILSGIHRPIKLLKDLVVYRKYMLGLDLENKDDIYISTYMKSGTTWMQMILYQLTTDGDMNFGHIYDVVPYVDTFVFSNKKVECKSVVRVFKTHLFYDFFPRHFNGKFICVLRNGMDVSVSQYHHHRDLGEADLTFQDSYNKYFDNGSGSWFRYTKRWIENRNNHKILFVRYEDLKNDLEKSLDAIAAFCNVRISESDRGRILERCSFSYMKQYEEKFGFERPVVNYNNFIRQGRANEGIHSYDQLLLERYKKSFEKELSGLDLLESYKPH